MLIVFSPNFVADTKIIFDYNLVALLKLIGGDSIKKLNLPRTIKPNGNRLEK